MAYTPDPDKPDAVPWLGLAALAVVMVGALAALVATVGAFVVGVAVIAGAA